MTSQNLNGPLQWVIAGFRAAPWYGFLFALIAAELFAGRALRGLVGDSLGRPSFRELQGLLRRPLGDPGLRLGFWRPTSRSWTGADGAPFASPGPGQKLTQIERDGQPAVAIVHDSQLSEDPELLQAAGAVALLALENAELEVAWKQALDELRGSHARLAAAADRERRKVARDLHDGAQQRFVAAAINITLADELAGDHSQLNERLSDARTELEEGLEKLREVAHGIYPQELARSGLAGALTLLSARNSDRVAVVEACADRFASDIELAIYYCCVEAIQNAFKHAGRDAQVAIRLYADSDQLHLEVGDNGRGFDMNAEHDGVGLQNMRDRLGAVGGQLEIRAELGHGTRIFATVPYRELVTPQPDLAPAQ